MKIFNGREIHPTVVKFIRNQWDTLPIRFELQGIDTKPDLKLQEVMIALLGIETEDPGKDKTILPEIENLEMRLKIISRVLQGLLFSIDSFKEGDSREFTKVIKQ